MRSARSCATFSCAPRSELTELDPRVAELVTQLVERRLDRRRLRDRVTTVLGRHRAQCSTGCTGHRGDRAGIRARLRLGRLGRIDAACAHPAARRPPPEQALRAVRERSDDARLSAGMNACSRCASLLPTGRVLRRVRQ
jgi:hypothetical protein